MTETPWTRITEVFDRAIELPAAERAAFLARACEEDDPLREQVERLLAAHDRAGGFLERPALAGAGAPAPMEGRLIGPWRLLREIGHGGMGAVYLAERADRQFDRQIALKLIRAGMDSEAVQRGFRTERQILASLDHPHIARLYDGGTTADGQPYFVMEYIEGEPIDRYADARRLPVAARLELFRQVCSAVSFAHQHLVVHRDIKPTNVLVTADGTARLLDFGIARILDEGEPDGELRTATAFMVMTPEYASPEQLHGFPATTLSDVYSLGVMLYELLCGRPPYRFPTRSIPAILRMLATAEPRRPSVAIDAPSGDGASPGPTADQIGDVREGSADRLRRRLEGDLDTIVLKAMHRDPTRRYASAEQLSEDLRRHLAGLPVLARPDTLAYRARKFAGRNRAAVIAAAMVVLSLVAGVIATTWQARRAREAQARAERRFNDVRALARAVLFDYHDAIKDLAGSTPVRERLVKDGLAYLDALAADAGRDPSLQRELASAYDRLADIQGGTMFANLGNTAGALESYGKAGTIWEPLVAADSSDARNRRGYANNLVKRGQLLWEMGEPGQALEYMQRATPILEVLSRDAPDDDALRSELIRALDTTGMLLQETGSLERAMELHLRQLALCEAMLAADTTSTAARRGVSVAHDHIATALISRGAFEEALVHNRRALTERARLTAEVPHNADFRRALAVSYYNDGEILGRLGRPREALASYRRDVEIVEELSKTDPRNEQYRGDLAYGWVRIGDMQAELGQPAAALASYRTSLAIRSADVEADPTNVWKRASLIEVHAKLAGTLAGTGEPSATAHSERALALMEQTELDPMDAMLRPFFATTFADLGRAHATRAARAGVPPQQRRQEWTRALDLGRRSQAIWRDLHARGILPAADSAQATAVARDIGRYEEALRN